MTEDGVYTPLHEPHLCIRQGTVSLVCMRCMKEAEVTASEMGKFMELAQPDKQRALVRPRRTASSDTLAGGKAGAASLMVKLV